MSVSINYFNTKLCIFENIYQSKCTINIIPFAIVFELKPKEGSFENNSWRTETDSSFKTGVENLRDMMRLNQWSERIEYSNNDTYLVFYDGIITLNADYKVDSKIVSTELDESDRRYYSCLQTNGATC